MLKKIFIGLLALTLINLTNCYGGTLNNLGLTNFLFDSNHFSAVSQYHVQSYFVDNFRVTKDSTLDFWAQPTPQNFKFDDVLANAKTNGVFNIWRFQGAFAYQAVTGKQNKVNPVRDTDDPLQQSSYAALGRLAKQVAIRYADDSAPYLSQAKVHHSIDYQNNVAKAGLGLVGAEEYTNEWDFKMEWSGAKITYTPEMGAVGFKVFMDSIRSVSKTMKIIMGGTINPRMETFTRFIGKLQELYKAEGKQMPTDWYLNFHWYMRNGSIDQGNGTWGVSPETAGAYRFGKQMDSLCTVYHLPGWYCTETGWSTYDTGTNVSLAKQNAPVLQGYDIYHSQGICMVRLALIWGATKYCQGITFWNRKDNDDTGAYQNGGVNYANWEPKYCQTIVGDFETSYRNHDITNFRQVGELYGVDLKASASTATTTLVWTNLNKIGDYDAMPRPGILEIPNQSPVMTPISPTQNTFTAPANITFSVNATDNDGSVTSVVFYNGSDSLFTDTQSPYTYTVNGLTSGSYQFKVTARDNNGLASSLNFAVTVNDVVPPAPTGVYLTAPLNHQWKWSDGQPVKIIGHNSPETIFAYLDYNFLIWLHQHGANSIYCAVNGKEPGHQISPYKNNDPLQGFDDNKVNGWVAYSLYWLNLDPRNVVELVLSEKETHDLYTLQQHKDVLQYLVTKFAPCNGRIFTNREEVPNGWSKTNALYDYEKQIAPGWIRFMHDLTNGNPWSGNYGTDRIQGLSMQDNVSAFNQHMLNEGPKNANWVCIASEMTGGFKSNDTVKAQTLWTAGGIYNAGVEVYVSCCDQSDTHSLWYLPYAPVFDKLKQLSGTVVTPPDTTHPSGLTIEYSTSFSHAPSKVAGNTVTITSGSYWWFVKQATAPVTFTLKKGTQVVKQTTDQTATFDLNGSSNVYFQSGGIYTLTVLNAQGTKTVTITVQ